MLQHLHTLRENKYANCCWGKEPTSMKKQKSEWLQMYTAKYLFRKCCKIHSELFFVCFKASWLLCMWHQKRLIMMLSKWLWNMKLRYELLFILFVLRFAYYIDFHGTRMDSWVDRLFWNNSFWKVVDLCSEGIGHQSISTAWLLSSFQSSDQNRRNSRTYK